LQGIFNSKLELCYPGLRVRDMGRKDYYERSERIGFKFQKNPIINLIKKLHKKLVKPVIGDAIQKTRELKIKKDKYCEEQSIINQKD
jgi:hypothetical protein